MTGQQQLDAARGHGTATLHEATAAVHRRDGLSAGADPRQLLVDPAIRAAWPGARVAGPAFTVQGVGGDNLALHRALVAAPTGHVMVAAVDSAAHGHWGEVMAVAAQQRGLNGLVIDGGVRDRLEMSQLGFGVFSRNDTVLGTAKDVPGDLDIPVRVGGVTVCPGDLIVGDADGVLIVPGQDVSAVLAEADRRVDQERDIFTALRGGRSTLQVYGLDPLGVHRTHEQEASR